MRNAGTILATVLFAAIQALVSADVGDAVDNTSLVWGSSPASSAPWFAQSAYTHDGVDAARSGAVGNVEQSDLTATVTGPGTLTFWWKVSSQNNPGSGYYDILYFWYGNSQGMSLIYGDVDWTQKTVEIPEGVHTLNWSYAKDISGSSGLDAGFLDQVVYTLGGGDTTPPGAVVNFHAMPRDGEIELLWTPPADTDLAGIRIQRGELSYPADEDSGTTVFDGGGSSAVDSGLVNGTMYYYSAFAYDTSDNFSTAAHTSMAPRITPVFVPADIVVPLDSQTYGGGVGNDYIRGVLMQPNGEILAAGYMKNDDADGDNDALLLSVDMENDITTVLDTIDKPISESSDYFFALCQDGEGSLYACGKDEGTFPPYVHRCLLRKYNSEGVFQWERGHYVDAWNDFRGVCTDSQDNVIAVGYEFGGWDARKGQWVIDKYDKNGNRAAGFPINYNFSTVFDIRDYAQAVAVAPGDSFVVAGIRGVAANLTYDIHVRKYSASGSLIWEDTYNGAANKSDVAYCVAVDGNGEIYVSGYEQMSDDSHHWLLIKYGAENTARAVAPRRWVKRYPFVSGRPASPLAMGFTPEGELLVGGYFQDAAGISQSALFRIDPIEGILLGEQLADLEMDNTVYCLGVFNGQLLTGGYVGNGTDYDMLITLSEFVKEKSSIWLVY